MEFLGEYNQNVDQKNISPEVFFLIDLNNAYNFLNQFLNFYEYDLIKNNLDYFKNKLYKNPALILISFIVVKQSHIKNHISIDPTVLKSILNNQYILPLIKEQGITIYDVVRYARYIELHVPNIIESLQKY